MMGEWTIRLAMRRATWFSMARRTGCSWRVNPDGSETYICHDPIWRYRAVHTGKGIADTEALEM